MFPPEPVPGAGLLSDEPRLRPDDLHREANHRIANNLAVIAGLVRMHAAEATARAGARFSGAEVRSMLDEIGARIDTVGRLHRLLSGAPAGAALELGGYVADIAETLVASMADGERVTLAVRSQHGCYLHPDLAGVVALIVSELITNAIKHAHPAGAPGKVMLRCGEGLAGSTYVEVEDDGVGLPENFDPWKDGGLGFQVVRGLAQQLGARLIFDAEGIGLRVRLIVPVDAMAPAPA